MATSAEKWAQQLQRAASNVELWDSTVKQMYKSGDIENAGGGGYSLSSAAKYVAEQISGVAVDEENVSNAEPYVFKDGSGFLLYAGENFSDIIFLPENEVADLRKTWAEAREVMDKADPSLKK